MTDKPSDDEIEAVARAIVVVSKPEWFTPVEMWTKKDLKSTGVWKEAKTIIRALDAVREARAAPRPAERIANDKS